MLHLDSLGNVCVKPRFNPQWGGGWQGRLRQPYAGSHLRKYHGYTPGVGTDSKTGKAQDRKMIPKGGQNSTNLVNLISTGYHFTISYHVLCNSN